jgi:hypothetical protein
MAKRILSAVLGYSAVLVGGLITSVMAYSLLALA